MSIRNLRINQTETKKKPRKSKYADDPNYQEFLKFAKKDKNLKGYTEVVDYVEPEVEDGTVPNYQAVRGGLSHKFNSLEFIYENLSKDKLKPKDMSVTQWLQHQRKSTGKISWWDGKYATPHRAEAATAYYTEQSKLMDKRISEIRNKKVKPTPNLTQAHERLSIQRRKMGTQALRINL